MSAEANSLMEIKKKIQAADMVLVGIGEEFEDEAFLREKENYAEICGKIAEAGAQWVVPYVNYLFLKEDTRLKKAYEGLTSLLQGKNYFILSYCMDGLLSDQELKPDRMAEFCGNWRHFTGEPEENEKIALYREIEACVRGEKSFRDLKAPVSLKTCQPCEFNTLYAEHFEEPNYKENWDRYLKWLQGTLNKKLCILELGAGMRNLNTIRIRYEKIAELNLKSDFIRIHEYLYQIPAGLAERGTGIQKNAVYAMEELKKM